MKKLLSLLIVGLMLFAGVTAAFAEEPEDLNSKMDEFKRLREEFIKKRDEIKQLREDRMPRYEVLKEFTEEIHQINALRIERNNLKNQIIEKNDTILDLYIEARENDNKEALEQAREKRQGIQGINQELRGLHEQLNEARRDFKEEIKNNNIESAREYINQIIEIKTAINEKMQEKIEMLDEIIDILY